MSTGGPTPFSSVPSTQSGVRLLGVLLVFVSLSPAVSPAATFSGNARVEVADSTSALSWNATANALSVSCWFKLSIASGTNLTENMTILANRLSGSQNENHAYWIQFNSTNANIEFSSRGNSGIYTNTLIERPYLERWYHVAIVRQGNGFSSYVDGRAISGGGGSAGDSSGGSGMSIGGLGDGSYFFGDIQEVAIHQTSLTPPQIRAFMFADLPVTNLAATLRGYFKLSSTNNADRYLNFAFNPPADAVNGQPVGPGASQIQFEELDLAGEQSLFDSSKNGGRDAITPLSGNFGWQQTALARPTPGIAFDWRFSYASSIAASGNKLGDFDPFEASDLGRGWRHTFETRLLPEGGLSEVRLLQWDGSIETWLQGINDATGTPYRTRHKEYRGELRRLVNGEFEWTTPERSIYHFRNPFPSEFDPPPDDPFLLKKGFLEEIRDFNSNTVRVIRDQLGAISSVVDTAGGAYVFARSNSLIRSIAFGAWQLNFAYDGTSRLISKTLTNTSGDYTNINTTWQFVYFTNGSSSNLLERIIDPRTNDAIRVAYDQYGRKTNEVDALGRATATRYGVPGKRQITHIDPGGFSWIESYDRKGRILSQQDPLTNITSYTYDERGNRTSITKPLGWTNYFGYDDRANVIARTNALNEVTRWVMHTNFNKAIQQITPQPADTNGWTTWTNFYTYDSGGNLTDHSDFFGWLVRYTYSTNGLVLSSTDANTNTTHFAYSMAF